MNRIGVISRDRVPSLKVLKAEVLSVMLVVLMVAAWCAPGSAQTAAGTSGAVFEEGKIDSQYVSPIRGYGVVLPPGYDPKADPYPVLFWLHGGGRDHNTDLKARWLPVLAKLWEEKRLPPMVVAQPDCDRSLYLDCKGDKQGYESFVVKEFIPFIKKNYNVAQGKERVFIGGLSMGGLGCLRIAFKYPELFQAVAAMEPAIDPGLELADVEPKYRSYRPDQEMEKWYGKPIDTHMWRENNPAWLVLNKGTSIKASGLEIMIEVGNEDLLLLYDGTEFLHRKLLEQGLQHEYRLVHGANHIGRTLVPRFEYTVDYLARQMEPKKPDPEIEQFKKYLEKLNAPK